ncbi:unnamed protein product [Ceratitis capitata]|uniref:(Mediterranean fruit fly) hypothetical protein n=1 Tax=Ceratitis capitata TaxID=7213 RepID=A0A811UJ19_CERCA|nr:unnamed protein product [Ceratitis capitata]
MVLCCSNSKSALVRNTMDSVNQYIIFDKYIKALAEQKLTEQTKYRAQVEGVSYSKKVNREGLYEKSKKRHLNALKSVRDIYLKGSTRKLTDNRNKLSNTKKSVQIIKPNTGFVTYCEIASVHGFRWLVGATIRQRVFWLIILGLMLVTVSFTLWTSMSLHEDDPTILYTEPRTIWDSSFPSITLCNFNYISKRKLNKLLNEDFSPQTIQQIRPYLRYLLYNVLPVNATPTEYQYLDMILKSKNYTHLEFLQKISPDCQSQLIRCKLHDHIRPCRELFQRIETENGFCCSFIYDENLLGKDTKGQTMSFGYRWGLTILLDPQVEDYYASRSKLAGFQIFSHETADRISMDYPHQMVFARNEIDIRVTTSLTYAIPYVRRYDVDMRRCYFNNERKLLTFSNYTQYTCFLDCRSRQMLATCGCVPPLWSRTSNWSICTLTQASCVKANMERIMRTINHVHRDVEPYKSNPNSERYICQCYPNCNLYIYNTYYDVTPLERNFSMNDMEFL